MRTTTATILWSCTAVWLFVSAPYPGNAADTHPLSSAQVGERDRNTYVTPVNQILTPVGRQVELPGLRPQALALSPNGKLLAVSGKSPELILINPETASVVQRVRLLARDSETAGAVSSQILHPDKEAQVSYTGLVFSPSGDRLFLSSVNGSIKVFSIDNNGRAAAIDSFSLPPATAPDRKVEIPAGLAVSRDGKRLYAVLNLSNRLAELDDQTGKVIRMWDVGVAPYDVVLAAEKAFVSNWGGRRPDSHSLTGPAGRGMLVRVDDRYIANEGSVSVIDLEANRVNREILTGRHASALAVSPDSKWLVVANSAADTLSVIDVRRESVVETIWARQNAAELFGASPNAITFDKSGRHLFVANGTQNAVGVVRFSPGASELLGLIPAGWFPGATVYDRRRDAIYVANIKGTGIGKRIEPGEPRKFNSHQYFGTVSLIDHPAGRHLSSDTRQALDNIRYPLLAQAKLPARAGQPPRPVPERVGEPSVFKHVVYIIKENRTYDQVFGDISQGNSDASLCIFGEKVTPNQHKLVREFVLLDNTYCSAILSADGHQWATTAMATDYMEKSFAGFPRSYPDGMGDDEVDALAYSPGGFIWDNALKHRKTLRDYGEFAITDKRWTDKAKKQPIHFLDYWKDYTNHSTTIQISSRPAIESLRPYLATNTVGWDLDIPDQFRADFFIKELAEFERNRNLPDLMIVCLPNDHTSGTSPRAPTPAAQVADNDLAFGRIVEAISRSSYWPETCIFTIEDDPQDGWDHVSGYRTTAYVVSPYTKRHQVVSTQYNQTSLLRTMELILGLPPMNQLDAVATPMSDCFMNRPDLTPFKAVANEVALDTMNPETKKVSNLMMRRYARISAKLDLRTPDRCPEDLLNRILWHAMKGPESPYPAWAIAAADKD